MSPSGTVIMREVKPAPGPVVPVATTLAATRSTLGVVVVSEPLFDDAFEPVDAAGGGGGGGARFCAGCWSRGTRGGGEGDSRRRARRTRGCECRDRSRAGRSGR